MNKVNIAMFFAALLVVGVIAAPRKILESSDDTVATDAQEHQRILAELEEVSSLRERMLQEGESRDPLQRRDFSSRLASKDSSVSCPFHNHLAFLQILELSLCLCLQLRCTLLQQQKHRHQWLHKDQESSLTVLQLDEIHENKLL